MRVKIRLVSDTEPIDFGEDFALNELEHIIVELKRWGPLTVHNEDGGIDGITDLSGHMVLDSDDRDFYFEVVVHDEK